VHRNSDNEGLIAPRAFPPPGGDGAVVASSLWLYLGFIGAAAFGGGLILLFDGHTSGALALAIAIFGASLAPASWLIGWRVARESLGEAPAERSTVAENCAELAAWPGVAALREPRRR
jgi:hypothetical protein